MKAKTLHCNAHSRLFGVGQVQHKCNFIPPSSACCPHVQATFLLDTKSERSVFHRSYLPVPPVGLSKGHKLLECVKNSEPWYIPRQALLRPHQIHMK